MAVTPAGSLHPLKMSLPEIRPDEIPDVPVNRFLFRGGPPPTGAATSGDNPAAGNAPAPSADSLADAGNLQETFGDGAASRWKSKAGTSKSGRKMKGRGAFKFRSPSPEGGRRGGGGGGGGGGSGAAADRERRERNLRADRTWGRARKELEERSKKNEEERSKETKRYRSPEKRDERRDDRRRDRLVVGPCR